MAVEKHIYDYVKELYETHSQFRIARQARIANLLVVIGLLTTITLLMFMEIPTLFPNGGPWKLVLVFAALAALACELLVIYKLVGHILGRFTTYRSPGLPKKAFEALLKAGDADERELLRGLVQNYVTAIEKNRRSGAEGLRGIGGITKLARFTVALICVFVVLWLAAMLVVSPVGLARPGIRNAPPENEEARQMLMPEDDAGAVGSRGPSGDASGEPAPEAPGTSEEPTSAEEPSVVVDPIVIDGTVDPPESKAERGKDK